VVVAVRAVLVAFFEFLGVFAEGFFAFFAGEYLFVSGLVGVWVGGWKRRGEEGKDRPFQFFGGEGGLLFLGGILRSRTIFGLGGIIRRGISRMYMEAYSRVI
jgi:hypothetical protein